MAKIKTTVNKEAFSDDSVEQPVPGVYKCRVAEINSGFSKNDDGKLDKERPRLEVIYRVDEGKYKGARLFQYLTFTEATEWKLAQFLRAFDLADPDKAKGNKVTAEWDTAQIAAKVTDMDAKTMKVKPAKTTGHPGLLCKVRVAADSNLDGEYRAKPTGVFKLVEDETDEEAEEFDVSDESEESEDEEEEFEEEEEEEGEEEESEPYTEDDLKALDRDELKEVAEAYEVKFGGKKKSEVIKLILEAQEAALSSEDEDDEDMPF